MKASRYFALTTLALAAATGAAQAEVVCNNCGFTGAPGANLGVHSPITESNSTFGNATTGTNGNFANTWLFSIDPAGLASVNAIFLPIANVNGFEVRMFEVDSSTCAANTANTAGACSAVDLGSLIIASDTPVPYATAFDFTTLDAGTYAFVVAGQITGLGPNQPASYTGNLQVQQVPEPASLALAGLGLIGLAALRRKGQA